MAKKKYRGNSLVETLFSGFVAGGLMAALFQATTSPQIKAFSVIGFIIIGLLIAYAFWRSIQ